MLYMIGFIVLAGLLYYVILQSTEYSKHYNYRGSNGNKVPTVHYVTYQQLMDMIYSIVEVAENVEVGEYETRYRNKDKTELLLYISLRTIDNPIFIRKGYDDYYVLKSVRDFMEFKRLYISINGLFAKECDD